MTNKRFGQVVSDMKPYMDNSTAAQNAITEYETLWSRAPKLKRGNEIRIDILKDGLRVWVNGQDQGIVKGPKLGVFQAKVYLTSDTGFTAEALRLLAAGIPTTVPGNRDLMRVMAW